MRKIAETATDELDADGRLRELAKAENLTLGVLRDQYKDDGSVVKYDVPNNRKKKKRKRA